MAEQLSRLPLYLTGHLQLSLLALALGVVISLPLGVWVSRRPRVESLVLGVASVLQTIPALALLALMVPLLAWVASLGAPIRSIGFLPAVIALALYSILPILRNTVTGLSQVDPALIEAARSVGMTPRQRLRLVELPLALPVVVAGLRTATVWVVGSATLATPVGATSLGNYLFSGLQTRNFSAVVLGSVSAAALALGLDAIVRTLEVGVRDRRRSKSLFALALLIGLCAYALGSALYAARPGRGEVVRIGAKNFTEQYILAEALALQVESMTGRPAEVVPALGSTVAFDAVRTGEIDVSIDYSGTLWATILERDTDEASRSELLTRLQEDLPRSHGVTVVAALGFENTYALAMRAEQADRLGIRRISDLQRHAGGLSIGADYEFFDRREWQQITQGYGLEFRERRTMDPALMYQAVAAGQVDVISAYSTDGRIEANDLLLLEDDRGVIPPYDAVLLIQAVKLTADPALVEALQTFDHAIPAQFMRTLNWQVDELGGDPAGAARELLQACCSGHETP